ncbi:DUF4817 domain-containing protein [Trichonephila clavipes]|nr:DUF4817 domain-containing protein [Trichonephila clavipes]
MTHISNERATETVLFAGMCAREREKYANFSHFLADQRACRKMATSKQKAFCVIQFAKTKSAITVQQAFRIKFGCQPSFDNNIRWWYHQVSYQQIFQTLKTQVGSSCCKNFLRHTEKSLELTRQST